MPVNIDANVAPKSNFIENLATKAPCFALIDLIAPVTIPITLKFAKEIKYEEIIATALGLKE